MRVNHPELNSPNKEALGFEEEEMASQRWDGGTKGKKKREKKG